MTYKSKRTLASMLSGLLLILAYILTALGPHAPEASDMKGWAILVLIFIGIGIAATIVIQILFHIGFAVGMAVQKRGKDMEVLEQEIESLSKDDEMDKAIEFKSAQAVLVFCGMGVMAFLIALALGGTFVLSFHLLIGLTALGNFAEGIASIVYYERGV
jgi:uncharacterized protein YqgQ